MPRRENQQCDRVLRANARMRLEHLFFLAFVGAAGGPDGSDTDIPLSQHEPLLDDIRTDIDVELHVTDDLYARWIGADLLEALRIDAGLRADQHIGSEQ